MPRATGQGSERISGALDCTVHRTQLTALCAGLHRRVSCAAPGSAGADPPAAAAGPCYPCRPRRPPPPPGAGGCGVAADSNWLTHVGDLPRRSLSKTGLTVGDSRIPTSKSTHAALHSKIRHYSRRAARAPSWAPRTRGAGHGVTRGHVHAQAKGPIVSNTSGLMRPVRPGTEPGTFASARKPMIPIIARRPLLISLSKPEAFFSGEFLAAIPKGS